MFEYLLHISPETQFIGVGDVHPSLQKELLQTPCMSLRTPLPRVRGKFSFVREASKKIPKNLPGFKYQ